MMPSDAVQTSQQFAYTGVLSAALAVLVGVTLAVAVAYLAWRESRLTRRWVGVPLAVLRIGAIAVICWMLAGPAIVTTVRRMRSKSIAILVDRSGSMETTDPADDTAGAQWSAALAGTAAPIDEAATLLNLAAGTLSRIGESMPGREVAVLQSRARRAVEAAASRVGTVQALSDVSKALSAVLASLDRSDFRGQLPGTIASIQDCSAKLTMKSETANAPATPRIAKVTEVLNRSQKSWLNEVSGKSRVLRYAFDTDVTPVDQKSWAVAASAPPPGSAPTTAPAATDIAGALEHAQRDSGSPLEAVVLITDGGHNGERDPVKLAAAAGTPLFVVPIGRQTRDRDVFVHHVQGPRSVFKDSVIVIDGAIDATGYPNQTLKCELLNGEQVIDQQTIDVNSDAFVRRIRFNAKADTLGRHEYTVRIEPQADERVKDNNSAKLSVNVVEDKMTILLADALPRWEYRYLRNLFRRDEHVVFEDLMLGNPADVAGARSLGRDLDALARYRVIILGDLSPAQLPVDQQELLEKYVAERDGTLIVIAGDTAMPAGFAGQPLERLIPTTAERINDLDTGGFDLLVTADGRVTPALQLEQDPTASEQIWRDISDTVPLLGLSEYSRPKPQAHVLLGAAVRAGPGQTGQVRQRAFLSWQYYGGGRVVYLAAPQTYRLRQRFGDRYHYQFWGQLLQWAISRDMTGGPRSVQLATDKTRYGNNEDVEATVRLSRVSGDPVTGAKPSITASAEQKSVATVALAEDPAAPGVYRGTIKHLPAGPVRLEAVGAAIDELLKEEKVAEPVVTTVAIDPPDSPELRDTRCNMALLKQLAEVSHGAVVAPTALAAAVSTLDLSPAVTESTSQQPLWTNWTCLWIFIGCLTAEWTIRKLSGLA